MQKKKTIKKFEFEKYNSKINKKNIIFIYLLFI